jgi:hypothetical protein
MGEVSDQHLILAFQILERLNPRVAQGFATEMDHAPGLLRS